MRPVRLEVKGFTAYRDTQVVDFEDLDLFAITGPTGSGKSSLLDAITYALYGKAPRVGKSVSQLIAQGQPRLSVILEFEVDGSRYRVFRDTPTKGASSIRLERLAEDEWRSFGDGADRILEAGALIEQVVGLDYLGFTRAVILPQGEFAGFLKGEPKERRRILTQLLDLDLFEKMGKRAGELARDAKSRAEGKREVLAQYADVDKTAVREARRIGKEAAARSQAMSEVERSLEGLAKEWDAQARRIQDLEEIAEQAAEVASSASLAATGLEGLASEVRAAEERAASLEGESVAAAAALEEARGAVSEIEERSGTAEILASLRATLEELRRLETRIAKAEESRARAGELAKERALALEQARQASTESAKALERAEATVAEAEKEHDRVHTADRVAALVRGKAIGDPCPVCERPLEAVPKVDARGLDEAVRMLETARTIQKRAEAAWSRADRDVVAAERDLDAAREDEGRRSLESAACADERRVLTAQVESALGGSLPEDPLAEIEARTQELRAARDAVTRAEAAAKESEKEAATSREAARSLTARTGELVGSLRALPVKRVLQLARGAVPEIKAPSERSWKTGSDPGAAADAARAIDSAMRAITDAVGSATAAARKRLDEVLDRARELLPAGMPVALVTDVEQLLQAVRATAKALVEAATVARKDAERMAQRLAEQQDLEKQSRALEKDGAVYQALAAELRADRLIDFLQGEALELLAAAGSERLLFLSQGRYRLAFEEDEFFVEDSQNGDERRSVRTLSGGETFLASLALALALSDQIQSLAVTTRAPLRSLFIDEGFGALDQEVLEVASEALSQLGGQDRLVGVITHVSELAERLPVRIEVKKLPSGSRLERAS